MEDFQSKYTGEQVEEFLDKINEYEGLDLSNYATIEALTRGLDRKEDVIIDLEEIRSGAYAGATALQEHQDISHLASKDELASVKSEQDERIAALDSVSKEHARAISEHESKIELITSNIGTLTDEVGVLTGDGDGSIVDTVSKEIAKIVSDSPEDLETLRDIADFISSDPTKASQIVSTLDDHEDRISDIEEKQVEIVVMSEDEYNLILDKGDKLYFLYEE